MTRSLDLGCGASPRNPFEADELYGNDVREDEVMNEIWRVLKPEGRFLSFTPAFPHPEAFRDPTHVNIITDQTFPAYFDQTNRWASAYGFKGAFLILSQQWRGPRLVSILKKTTVL